MKKRQSRAKTNQTPMEQARAMTDFSSQQTDPQGSYTGRPADPLDPPVQDADDL
ncbi:hypothetical protein SDC9_62409 [bioreactor metagenome]|uniref:Uncharacterized protein n=1 Tax=bioreactor metagenome TaxID=1076179 RepID=A0A644XIM0_9ZZZZ|nr:hypothetical protein [Oscillibacter sp.]MEA4993049.1 hypothetical protein [Oscillibacter sp.]